MARDYSKPLKPHMKPTMTVRCKVCGGLIHALIEPYCYTDQDFLKAIEKYKKKNTSKKIYMLDKDSLEVLRLFNSLKEAQEYLKKNNSEFALNISDVSTLPLSSPAPCPLMLET